LEADDRLVRAFWCVALAVGAFASITKSFVGFLILAVAAAGRSGARDRGPSPFGFPQAAGLER